MAMTKKEQAEMKAAIDRAELLAALRWTTPIKPDVQPPEYPGYTEGWSFNSHGKTVEEVWSESTAHGSGPYPGRNRRTASQNAVWLYSTKAIALAAMRHELEVMAATVLREVDRKLHAERNK